MPSNDLSLYSTYAHEWWQPGAPRFRSLQNITPFRLSLIDQFLGSITGKVVYDVGCGGGLISIPLLDRAANVCGVDISEESIKAAKTKAQGRGQFGVADARALPFDDSSAHYVLLMDVVDHIADYPKALSEAARVVKGAGKVVVGTINRTWQSWLGAILLGEGLRLIPPGTHRHSMFVRPDELVREAERVGLRLCARQGERVRILDTLARWAITLERGESELLAYTMVFVKEELSQ